MRLIYCLKATVIFDREMRAPWLLFDVLGIPSRPPRSRRSTISPRRLKRLSNRKKLFSRINALNPIKSIDSIQSFYQIDQGKSSRIFFSFLDNWNFTCKYVLRVCTESRVPYPAFRFVLKDLHLREVRRLPDPGCLVCRRCHEKPENWIKIWTSYLIVAYYEGF